uniref:Uncharacterized protein n=1 Tax=Quercus lobata TaxID=97700 RepID=A0A7N2RD75_QUELO
MSLSLLETPADKGLGHVGNGGNTLLLFSSPCTLTLGVGELDVDSSFGELETFLNSETYETLILGAALQLFQKRAWKELERIEDEHGHGDPMVSPSLQNTQPPPKFFSPNPTKLQSFHSNMASGSLCSTEALLLVEQSAYNIVNLNSSFAHTSVWIKLFVKDLKYLDSHEWINVEGNSDTFGITNHAQDYLKATLEFQYIANQSELAFAFVKVLLEELRLPSLGVDLSKPLESSLFNENVTINMLQRHVGYQEYCKENVKGFECFCKDLKYLDSHEWVKVEGNSATVGIIDHAQDHLGKLVEVTKSSMTPLVWVLLRLPSLGVDLSKSLSPTSTLTQSQSESCSEGKGCSDSELQRVAHIEGNGDGLPFLIEHSKQPKILSRLQNSSCLWLKNLINSSPYDKGWIIKVEVSNSGELNSLMDADKYTKFCEEEDGSH